MNRQNLFRLPQAIIRSRHAKGISQKDLAEAAGLDATRLSGIERVRIVGPARDAVRRLAAALALTDQETDALQRLGAHDRAMRGLVREFPPETHELLAACLDAARVLSLVDRIALTDVIRQLVRPRERLSELAESQEATMSE